MANDAEIKTKPTKDKTARDEGGILETVKVVVQALLIALVIRTLLFQPFNIPSGSLIPTLLIGDYLFVSKYTYGYSKHSMPFSPPLFSGRVWAAEPKRGDIAVFKLPTDNSTDYIKRVIGLPGDRIQMIDGILHINNVPVKRERIADYVTTDNWGRSTPVDPLSRDAAQRRQPRDHRARGRHRHLRQHGRLPRAGGPLLHDGRQPRQLARLARPQRRLRAVREFRRPRRDHLLLDRGWRLRLAGLGMALDGSLGPPVQRDQVSKAGEQGRKVPDLSRLEATLGHSFADRGLLATALTHMSAEGPRLESYQRLEFLGDRVLGLSIADMLFVRYPQAAEGDMSRRLADLVRKETCAEVALAWDIGQFMRLGEGEILGRRTQEQGDPRRCLRGGHRRGVHRWRLRGGARPGRARLRRAPAEAGQAAARRQDGAAGMGAGPGLPDADL